MSNNPVHTSSPSRVEMFSDGIFAIAITLLIIEIGVPHGEELNGGLYQALLHKWPHYLAFFIGFFTVLVCWINHRYTFLYVTKVNQTFCIVNAGVLFVVSFVVFPTAVLAEFIDKGEEVKTAVQFYGLTYILMALSARILWGYAFKYGLTNPEIDDKYKRAIRRMYDIGVIHTLLAFAISFWSVTASLLLYVALFCMFLLPANYVGWILKTQRKLIK